MESEKIAKRAVKISIASLFILIVLALILLSVLLTQVNATAEMSRKIELLSAEVAQLKNQSLK